MPITTPGLNSGLDTDEIIKKLVEAERAPIKKFEQQIEYIKYQTEALKELQKRIKKLEETLRKLYDYDSPFDKKLVLPSQEGYIDGVANKDADLGDHKIEIINLASKLKITSVPIAPEKEIPATTVTINGKSEKFEGGSIDDFNKFLNKKFEDDVNATKIRKNKNEEIIVLESKKEGLPGEFSISDDNGVLKDLGLISGLTAEEAALQVKQSQEKGATPQQMQATEKDEFVPVYFNPSQMLVTAEGRADISGDQRSMRLSPNAGRSFEILQAADANRRISVLKMQVFKIEKPQTGDEDKGPYSIETGPVENLQIKHLSLDTYNIQRERPAPDTSAPEKPKYGIKITTSTGERKVELQDMGENVEIPLDEVPVKVEFYTTDADITYRNVQLGFKVKQPVPPDNNQNANNGKNGKQDKDKTDPETERQKQMYPNLVEPAKNARMKLDDVEIEREKNDGLEDVVNGAQLNLKKPTPAPIKLTIAPNTEQSIERINDFIKEYNELVEYIRWATSGASVTKPGDIDYNELREKSGPLVADPIARNLLHGLRQRIFDAYPSMREPEIRILGMLGVSTGKPGASYGETKDGLLKLDEEQFRKMLAANPQAVRDFFGLDSNGNGKPDTGMAFTVVQYLKPYISPAKRDGIITAKIDSNDNRIKDLQTSIKKKEEQVKRYEATLVQKYTNMEKSVGKNKATGNYLKQRFKSEGQ